MKISSNAAKTAATAACAAVLMLGLAACEKKGPAEKAGEKMDHAVESVKDTGEKAADKVEAAADKAADKVQDAVK
ncbi:MAG: hypothetical protein ABI616_06125 [Pseudomonadota bacterium]